MSQLTLEERGAWEETLEGVRQSEDGELKCPSKKRRTDRTSKRVSDTCGGSSLFDCRAQRWTKPDQTALD